MRGGRRTEPGARIDGVLLLDKPRALSSNQALVRVRRLFGAAKGGHGGTLDPLATGLLPLAFGEATKFLHDLLQADKSYEALFALGARTSTGDAEGELLESRPVQASDAEIAAACAGFVGEIEQVPPMHSALKRDGRPLYAYARAGTSVERKARPVRIHALEPIEIRRGQASQGCGLGIVPVTVRVRVHCSKGTYVRVLAEDLGARLGCGAHLAELRRTGVGRLRIEDAVSLEALEACAPPARSALLAPIDALLETLPRIDLPEDSARRFMHGQRLALPEPVPVAVRGGSTARVERCDRPDSQVLQVRVYCAQRLLGVARFTPPALLAPVRLVACAEAAPRAAAAPPIRPEGRA
ncbi:MAG: tRNA pseudouridine(55) synthase TruB [Burkholderiales bacterium]|nr:MAG: tRNA pseudouridine(55) synthase TruB [Burkholderiales bacterium]